MERIKPQVTISLDEYNELLEMKKESFDSGVEMYKMVLGVILKNGIGLHNQELLHEVRKEIKDKGFDIKTQYSISNSSLGVIVTKI